MQLPVSPSISGSRARPSVRLARALLSGSLLLAAGVDPGFVSPAAADVASPAAVGDSWNVTLLGNYPGRFYDLWGYSDPSGEFALVTTGDSLLVIDVTNPATPARVSGIQRNGNSLHDVDVYGSYAYAAQQDGALRIVSLADPRNITVVGDFMNANITGIHTLYVSGGKAYLCMAGDGLADLRILSLANPVAPVEIGHWTHPRQGYPTITEAHEAYVRGNILYLSYLSGGLVVLDVSNPASPLPLGFLEYPGNFTHSSWTTDDGRYILTADETNDGHLRIWDGLDLANILPVSEYRSNPDRTIHQLNVKGEHAYISYYSDGLRIVDVADPTHPVEVGYYDTYPGSGPGFFGALGVYAYAPSGRIYISDRDTGLWIFSFNGARAGTVTGTVRGPDGEAIEGTTIAAIEPGKPTMSSKTGTYSLSFGEGTVRVAASRFGYLPDTTTVVVPGQGTLSLDFTLARLPSGTLSGTVRNPGGGAIPGILVTLEGIAVPPETTSASGTYDFGFLPSGTSYTLSAARFGYASATRSVTLATGAAAVEDFTLAPQIRDDFELHQGWTAGVPSDGADQGLWTRVAPNGTLLFGQPAQPYTDHTDPPGTKAYVTGQSPPGASTSAYDLDNGKTTLVSPIFDATFLAAPVLHYYRWISNAGPQNPGTGVFEAEISNNGGASWVRLERTSAHANAWTEKIFPIDAFVTPTSTMRLRFVAQDSVGTIFEAGVDDVSVDGTVVGAGDSPRPRAHLLLATPNPFQESLDLSYELPATQSARFSLFDIAGRRVANRTEPAREAGIHRVAWALPRTGPDAPAAGIYFLVFESGNDREVRKVARVR